MWVGKAITQWLTDIKKGTVPKSLVYKRLALESFARAVGETTPVHECTSVPIGAWVSELRACDLATPTVVNRIPIHPEFNRTGVLKHVARLCAAGEERLFRT